MLVLAIETSSRRGSAALLDAGQLLAEAFHDEPNAHGERLLALIDEVFARANRDRMQIDRIGVGRGPGAFTGLRIGLALAQGIAAGLHVPAVGIGSLRAMAAAVPGQRSGYRWPVLDARRGELFVACYDEQAVELIAPRAVRQEHFGEELTALRDALGSKADNNWLVGRALVDVSSISTDCPGFQKYHSDASDWPTAAIVGQLASALSETTQASPDYLRDADAILPNLPPCPLDEPAR